MQRRGIQGVERCYGLGHYGTAGKIQFVDKDKMWAFLMKMKGQKLETPLAEKGGKVWHSVDKYEWEVDVGYRQKAAGDHVVSWLVDERGIPEDVAKAAVDARGDSGEVVIKMSSLPGGTDQRPVKLYECDRNTHLLRVAPGAQGK